MSAAFFPTGAVELFFRYRPLIKASLGNNNPERPWLYLGSGVFPPEVRAAVTATPFTCDYSAPDPFQLVFNGEWHRLSVTLNRLDQAAYREFRNGPGLDRLRWDDRRRWYKTGHLMLNADDFSLFVRFALPAAGMTVPPDAPKGRLYYSGVLTDFAESSVNGRVQEVSLLIDCRPLYDRALKQFALYSEVESDFPAVTAT